MERYVLFYSVYCQHCKEFVNNLRKSGLFDRFEKVCVDQPRKTVIPKEIKSVPTIIVPQSQLPLKGNDAFQWLYLMNQHIQRQKQQEQQETQKSTKPPMSEEERKVDSVTNLNYNEGGVVAYSGSTMGGYSDQFSSLDVDREGKSTPFEHSFMLLGQEDKLRINAPMDSNDKNDKSDMSKAYERMMQQRDREIPQAPQRIQ